MYVFVIKVSVPPITAAQSINSSHATTDFQLNVMYFMHWISYIAHNAHECLLLYYVYLDFIYVHFCCRIKCSKSNLSLAAVTVACPRLRARPHIITRPWRQTHRLYWLDNMSMGGSSDHWSVTNLHIFVSTASLFV